MKKREPIVIRGGGKPGKPVLAELIQAAENLLSMEFRTGVIDNSIFFYISS